MPDPALPEGWADLPFFTTHWPQLWTRLQAAPDWQPAPDRLFRALHLTPPDRVRVVILGQDPYPTPGRATGLAFAFPKGEAPRDSLRNILRELNDDLGIHRAHGDLSGWAGQGVLLLNTVLSVPVGQPDGHRGWGWEGLTAQVLARVTTRPTAFALWGPRRRPRCPPTPPGIWCCAPRTRHPCRRIAGFWDHARSRPSTAGWRRGGNGPSTGLPETCPTARKSETVHTDVIRMLYG